MFLNRLLKPIDDLLNSITMYRLVLYYLILLLLVGLGLSFFGKMPFQPTDLLIHVAFILGVSLVTNEVFRHVYDSPTNVESVYITALILALVVTPVMTTTAFFFVFWSCVLAIAGKFIVAINYKHIFNPAALGLTITTLTLTGLVTWWVGSSLMLPFVLLGVFIVRKIRRSDLVFWFLFAALATEVVWSFVSRGTDPTVILRKAVLDSPLLFFAFIMITEPLTTPPTKKLQSLYGVLTGILFAPQFQIAGFFTTPQSALVLGNIFSYLVSPKVKLLLSLKEKNQLSNDQYNFVFAKHQEFTFTPGQYVEWTLALPSPDTRGNRRYFTIASSPTEQDFIIGVKFYEPASKFKQKLLAMKPGEKIIASQLAGDFTLPKDKTIPLVLVAGGIGVTPFRSILKYLIDTNEKRDIHIFYSNKTSEEILYKDIFDEAEKKLGIKTTYAITELDLMPKDWPGIAGRLTPDLLQKTLPDFSKRTYYLSGPHAMVTGYEELLDQMGVPKKQVVTDYFPGFA